jgi:hypothetical protein
MLSVRAVRYSDLFACQEKLPGYSHVFSKGLLNHSVFSIAALAAIVVPWTKFSTRGAEDVCRWDSPTGHGLWVDSVGNIYLADVLGKGITKYVRKR